jgi:hypothetical protein
MQNEAFSSEGFSSLQSSEMESINGGAAPKIPLGFSWKDIIMFGLANYEEIKQGLVEGWSYPDKK